MTIAKTYRFQVKNETGQTLLALAVKITALRHKFNSQATLQYEDSEAEIYSNVGTIANDAYDETDNLDNSSDLFTGGHFLWEVTAPASASGNVTLYVQYSTDGGTTWDTDGEGDIVWVFPFTATGTKRKSFKL